MKHRSRLEHVLHTVVHVLETITAIMMVVGILLAVFSMVTDVGLFRGVLAREHSFMEYIERVFTIVIGIEFLEMLCAPTANSVIQTLIFLVARHMIVGETTPVQDLISILSITILVVLRRWLHASKEDPVGIAPLITIRRIVSRRDGEKRAKREQEDEAGEDEEDDA